MTTCFYMFYLPVLVNYRTILKNNLKNKVINNAIMFYQICNAVLSIM